MSNNSIINSIVEKGRTYPEITREKAKNGYRITMQTTKIFLHACGYISADELNNPDLQPLPGVFTALFVTANCR